MTSCLIFVLRNDILEVTRSTLWYIFTSDIQILLNQTAFFLIYRHQWNGEETCTKPVSGYPPVHADKPQAKGGGLNR